MFTVTTTEGVGGRDSFSSSAVGRDWGVGVWGGVRGWEKGGGRGSLFQFVVMLVLDFVLSFFSYFCLFGGGGG